MLHYKLDYTTECYIFKPFAIHYSYGAAEVYYVPVTVDSKLNNSNPEVVTHVKTLTGFFFGGGDQLRIMESFYNGDAHIPSDVLRGIKESVLSNGGVVAG